MEPAGSDHPIDGGHDERTALDPIATLMDEHDTVLSVLEEMERESRDVDFGRAPRSAFWTRTLLFLDTFDEGLHHDKEENLLFPVLEAAGLSQTTGPTAVLRSEHERCRQWRRRIGETLAGADLPRFLATVQGFVDFERQHVLKENQILFPLARRLLSPLALEALGRAFVARD